MTCSVFQFHDTKKLIYQHGITAIPVLCSEVIQLTLVYSGPNAVKRSCRIAGSWADSTMFVRSIHDYQVQRSDHLYSFYEAQHTLARNELVYYNALCFRNNCYPGQVHRANLDPIRRKIFPTCQLVFHMTSEFSFKWQPHSLVEQLTGKANTLFIMMPQATGLTLPLQPTTTDKPNNGCQLAGNSACTSPPK